MSRAHLALVTGPFTADGVSCGPHPCAKSHGQSSRHRRKICREPVGGSWHRRGVGWPLLEVGPTPVPRANDSALGTELTSGPEDGSFAESWVNKLSAQSLSGPPVRPSVPRAKAIALGTEPALRRAWALALGTTSFFFSKLIVTLITYTSSQADYTHHRQLIFITGRLYSSQAGNIHHKHIKHNHHIHTKIQIKVQFVKVQMHVQFTKVHSHHMAQASLAVEMQIKVAKSRNSLRWLMLWPRPPPRPQWLLWRPRPREGRSVRRGLSASHRRRATRHPPRSLLSWRRHVVSCRRAMRHPHGPRGIPY
jgi:hypothetical protein